MIIINAMDALWWIVVIVGCLLFFAGIHILYSFASTPPTQRCQGCGGEALTGKKVCYWCWKGRDEWGDY